MLGNKHIMGQNILYYMNQMGLERKDFAKAINVPYSTLVEWINGNAYPRIDKIQRMADYFGIEKADLVESRTEEREMKGIRVPILGSVAAGQPIEMIEDVRGEVVVEPHKGVKFFALEIKGDSMSPRYLDGDTVIIRRQAGCENGQDALVFIGKQEGTLKKVFLDFNHTITLKPINQSYRTMFFSEREIASLPLVIYGVAVELRRKIV